jgi:hypothetical protein
MKLLNKFGLVMSALLAISGATQSAHAQIPELEFSILGGANLHMYSRSEESLLPDTASGGMSWILGGTAAIGAIEAGLFVARKTLTDAGAETNSWSSLDIPVLYRFGFWPVTLGVGGFYSVPIGTEYTDGSYGLVFGPRVFLPGGILLDTRFQWGLNQDRNSASSSNLQVMVGYNFF